jgi:hypothetical protein
MGEKRVVIKSLVIVEKWLKTEKMSAAQSNTSSRKDSVVTTTHSEKSAPFKTLMLAVSG